MRTPLILVLAIGGCANDSATPPLLIDYTAATGIDEAFKACVAAHLGQDPDADIRAVDAQTLKHLDCIDEGIESIAGIELFTALETLSLWENDIRDVSALSGLTQLRWLELGNNAISDIAPLSTLTGLERLGLSDNRLSDITSVQSMAGLEWLNLDNNRLSDVSALGPLEQLTWLTVEHNGIADDSAVEAVRALGADVYHQNQRDSSSAERSARGVKRTIDRHLATLSPRIAADGTVDFDLLVADKVFTVHPEFSGAVKAEGERLLLIRGSDTTPIGVTDGATATLCEADEGCAYTLGIKVGPDAAYDGHGAEPIVTLGLGVSPKPTAPDQAAYGEANTDLIDYVLASPNQFDAGSCLFMTTTGAVELLMHQHTDLDEVEYNGDTDLSERFLMSAYQDVPSSTLRYWLTDTVYTYNHFGGSLLNRDYPFTAGYVRETASGNLVPCERGDDGAYYSCSYNWFDERPEGWEAMLVDTPAVDRTVAFADPSRSDSAQWNVGLMDDEDVEKIKYMLRTRRAPVVVIYNHYLYWHADIIVGYDDTVSTDGCPMVESSMDHFDSEGASGYTRKIEAHMDEIGPCTSKGIFYVRDSIYDGGADEENYEYSPGFNEKYSKRIVERSYNWVKYLGNHAYSIHRK